GQLSTLAHKAAFHILFHDLLELFGDPIAFQGDGLLAILVDRGDRALAGSGQADADVGVFAFARAVDDATHDGDRHVLDTNVLATPLRHAVADVRLNALGELLEVGARGSATAGAGDHHRS